VDRAKLLEMHNRLFQLLEMRNEENLRLQSICFEDAYHNVKKAATPWHKAYLKEKNRWRKKYAKELRMIENMPLSRTEKQKLRAELDRVANAHADIAEAKVRAKKMKRKIENRKLTQWEMAQIKREVRLSHKRMKQKVKAAVLRSDNRNFWTVSLLSLAITIALIADIAILWWIFGEDVVRILNEHFPSIMSRLK
jgi:hypothetical protein